MLRVYRSRYRDVDGMAMFASSNMPSYYFRQGHDISVPLPPKVDLAYLGGIGPKARKYFATFKVSACACLGQCNARCNIILPVQHLGEARVDL